LRLYLRFDLKDGKITGNRKTDTESLANCMACTHCGSTVALHILNDWQ